MFVTLLIFPPHQLTRDEMVKLQRLAAEFSTKLADQFDWQIDESEDDQQSAIEEFDAQESVVTDQSVIGYLEDCFRL